MNFKNNDPTLRFTLYALLLAATLTSCVPLDQLPPGSLPNQPTSPTAATTYPDVDPPAMTINGNHFNVHGYRESEMRPVASSAENIYGRIASELGLYSYMSSGIYTLVLYKDHEEFMQKTKLPSWVRAASGGTTIYTYPGEGLEPALAFEMTSLVFANMMDRQYTSLRWLGEGLALSREILELSPGERQAFHDLQLNELRIKRVPFSQMTFAVPASRENRRKEVWFLQVESVVDYLLAQGSALSFGGFLSSLRSGADVDQALAANYPGKFRSLSDLENAWKYTL